MDRALVGLRQITTLSQKELLTLELQQSVKASVEAHWERKISDGIVPTEVKLKGNFDRLKHREEMQRLAEFEFKVAELLFACDWRLTLLSEPKEVHYFGIGTGEGFAKIVPLANHAGYNVVAYETCSIGFQNALTVLERQKTERSNRVYMADIYFACQKRYIQEETARVLIASRVVDVLTTQEPDWKTKARHHQKTGRTARRIGELLSYLDALLIHPCADDNPNAIWGDTTPYTLAEIKSYMEMGHGKEVNMSRLGKIDFHGHIYTAVLFRRKL